MINPTELWKFRENSSDPDAVQAKSNPKTKLKGKVKEENELKRNWRPNCINSSSEWSEIGRRRRGDKERSTGF